MSAVDTALWDLKRPCSPAGQPAARANRDEVPVYGSGGFTTYDERAARAQLERWTELSWPSRGSRSRWASPGAPSQPGTGEDRLRRRVIGPDADCTWSDGGYSRKQAVRMARAMRTRT